MYLTKIYTRYINCLMNLKNNFCLLISPELVVLNLAKSAIFKN
jgi:hypothetical protein